MLAAKKLLLNLMIVGGAEYANGGRGRGKGIVDRHFTAGNQSRYGWPPLSRDYFLRKAGTLTHQQMKAGKARGSALDKQAEFSSKTGGSFGIGHAKNLPMLVLSGDTRKAVTAGRAQVTASLQTGLVNIRFVGLPDYDTFLHTGTGKMAERSPVKPGPTDKAEIIAAMKREKERLTGRGGKVADTPGSVPAHARVSPG